MNTLRTVPDGITGRRLGVRLAAATLALGLAAGCAEDKPSPGPSSAPSTPIETTVSPVPDAVKTPIWPSCRITAAVAGREVFFRLNPVDVNEPEYSTQSADYDFGDGTRVTTEAIYNPQPYVYKEPGTYQARADLNVTVAQGVLPPIKNSRASCGSVIVHIVK